jgi:tetratricopeptide (TPR) repeat protein
MHNYFLNFLLILMLSTGSVALKAQDMDILLSNMNVQMDATQAVNDMYNFKFGKAEQQFRWIKQQYPNHPLPYFLMGLSQWWKIAPNVDEKRYDESLIAYMDTVILLAEKIYTEKDGNVEAAFFLSAANAFKGRLYAERREWTKAAVVGKNALKYLEDSRGQHDLSPEFLFGDALYNYYSVWIPENYPLLKPILWFFTKGDKVLGIKQLQEVSRNAFYTRTEAQMFLMRILAIEEGKPYEALQVSEYLAETFPDNPYFQRFYARLLYSTGKLTKTEEVSLDILAKIDSGMVGYEATSGRYAAFFLGEVYSRRMMMDKAKTYYQRAVQFGEEAEAEESGYYLYSLLNLAEIAEKEGEKKLAKSYYRQVKKYAKRSHPAHQKARRRQ